MEAQAYSTATVTQEAPTAIESLLGPGLYAGFDTGSQVCGFALVDAAGGVVTSGCWRLGSAGKANLELRLASLCQHMTDFVWMYGGRIRWAGIEEPFVGKNFHAAIVLGKAWGVIFGALLGQQIHAIQIMPQDAKEAATGKRTASKAEVRMYVEAAGVEVRTDDQSDAVAVAWAVRQKAIGAVT